MLTPKTPGLRLFRTAYAPLDPVKGHDLRSRPSLYRLAAEAQVGISNLTTRLRRLKRIHFIDGQKRIWFTPSEQAGRLPRPDNRTVGTPAAEISPEGT